MAKVKFEAIDDNSTENLEGINDDIVDVNSNEAEIKPSEEIDTSNETEELFYTGDKYNELRDAMQDTNFRLFLINNDLAIPGTLDEENDEIKFLDIVGPDDEKEFVLKDAPKDLIDLLDFKTLYNIENSEVEIPEGKEVSEAPHEEIVEYILSLKVKDEDTEDVEDDEVEIDKMEKEEDEDESNEE